MSYIDRYKVENDLLTKNKSFVKGVKAGKILEKYHRGEQESEVSVRPLPLHKPAAHRAIQGEKCNRQKHGEGVA